MNNIERELKIALTKEEYGLLLTVSNARPQLQTNFYFYCDGMPRETVVRVRLKQGGYLLCFKRLLSAHNGINVCDEREQSIDVKTAESFIADGLSAYELKTRLDKNSGLWNWTETSIWELRITSWNANAKATCRWKSLKNT